MSLETKVIEGFTVLALRHVGPFHTIGSSFGKLYEHLQENGIEHGLGIGLYHSDPGTVPPDELISDACVVIEDASKFAELTKSPQAGDLHIAQVPGGNYAVATHMGNHSGMGDTWHRFMEEFSASGFKYGEGVPFEMYMNDCDLVPEAEIRTDLYAPIAD